MNRFERLLVKIIKATRLTNLAYRVGTQAYREELIAGLQSKPGMEQFVEMLRDDC